MSVSEKEQHLIDLIVRVTGFTREKAAEVLKETRLKVAAGAFVGLGAFWS